MLIDGSVTDEYFKFHLATTPIPSKESSISKNITVQIDFLQCSNILYFHMMQPVNKN